MTSEPEAGDGTPPEPLTVRYNPTVQMLRALGIFAVASICFIIPLVSEQSAQDSWWFAGVLIATLSLWGVITLRRAGDKSPQVIIDENGVYFREWHAGTVPWETIEHISHSSAIRRNLLSAVTRNRRKPYLLFKLSEPPKLQPTARVPLSWWQVFMGELAIQEPVIQQFGLDTPVDRMLKAIESQIAAWRIRNPHLLEDAGLEGNGQDETERAS